jgi:hypothetical protein
MKKLTFIAVLVGFVICGCKIAQSASEKKGNGWQKLFDGKTLNGWVQHGGKARFSVEDGMIVGTTEPNTHNSFLCTEKDYSNFILELEFKDDPNLNSGVQIRSHTRPDPNFGEVVYGFQVDIDPTKRAWTGGIYHEGLGREWQQNLENNAAARKAFKSGKWNHLRIEVVGDTIKTWVNGVPAADFKGLDDTEGFIGLQVHKVRTNVQRHIYFKNIRIKVLN